MGTRGPCPAPVGGGTCPGRLSPRREKPVRTWFVVQGRDSTEAETNELQERVTIVFINCFSCLFIFERQRETEHEQGRGRERGGHRTRSRLQAPSCRHRARRGARTHGPRDRDLSRSRTLNRLRHPGAPRLFFLDVNSARPRGWLLLISFSHTAQG